MSENKVAVKSGYYFEIFNRDEIPSTLEKHNKKVKLNDIEYDLYCGTSLEDERKIDKMFGDRMGYFIDEYIVEKIKPKCALIGQDGNIFNLVGIASKTLKRNGMYEESKEMSNRVFSSHSYDEALCIIGEYVEITDEAGLVEEEEFE